MTEPPVQMPPPSPGRFHRWLAWPALGRLARHTFAHELAGIFAYALAALMVLPQFGQLLAQEAFDANRYVVAALSMIMGPAFLVAGLGGSYLAEMSKSKAVAGCCVLLAAVLGSCALLPPEPISAYIFILPMLLALILHQLALNARTGIWQRNYPARSRGVLFGLLMLVTLSLVSLLGLVVARLMDHWLEAYRVVYAVAGLGCLVTAWLYSRIRPRGERAGLHRRGNRPPRLRPMESLRVLRRDRPFALYMTWQMVLGSATLCVETIFAVILRDRFETNVVEASAALVVAPIAVRLVAVPLLGRWFDRVNFFGFRSVGAVGWGLSRFVLFWGVATANLPLVILGRAISGMGGSFGQLAWTLGHMHFAKADQGPLYMGTHMLLTSLRWALMPLVGMLLYAWVIDIHLLWITGLVQLLAAGGFLTLRKKFPHIHHSRAD